LKVQKNIKTIARNVLLIESDAIKKLTDYIDDDFEQCVRIILESKGRVIITGIGKSASIAGKIVATLNSTGTPAIFLHAADAIHGDIGMICKEDVVIAISKSGNTPEIKVLVPLLKQIGSQLIALVGNTQSYLAESADFILNATVEKEACPNNLAPTTSTTAALALGDALAVCLLESRNFTSEDFAKLHPGGALGKRLYLRVGDIYPMNECPTVKESANIQEIILEMTSKRLGATAVVDKEGRVVGIITDGDLRRMLKNFSDTQHLKANEIMSPNPKSIEPEEYAMNAMTLMREKNITQLIVVDKNKKILGFVHIHDLIKEGLV
jgi:arabinose-5-phosphate isomerase